MIIIKIAIWGKIRTKISELIKEFENMLETWGNLEVFKGKDYVGLDEVTGISTIHCKCYI